MTSPRPSTATTLVAPAGLTSRSAAWVAGWLTTPGSGAPFASLSAVNRILAAVMKFPELLVMVRRTVRVPVALLYSRFGGRALLHRAVEECRLQSCVVLERIR